ncbi:MAG: MBL fold metallo-hydrolase [Phaeodactylibacter sp.]|nr:MBL fold metallo-hydrolase [Phaeodactylibacter sp.]MCB9304401.1 MBL fold metallo-hydrolase [Lewinellaceae bacterium]HQU59122.1 MBL fold metallo-hydrolase [Saprospiraceae bacterium]
MKSKLQFLGAAGAVTGSKTLIEYGGKRLLVDCGLFQGLKELRLQNRSPFPVDPKTIETLLLTHAHLDHCGYIPLLVKNGFQGSIHCTEPTEGLSKIILKDSAKIQEEEAERANEYGYTKHKPAMPLYDMKDVLACLPQFVTHQYHEWVILDESAKFQFRNAGHILGSSMLELQLDGKTLLFTGDLGRQKPLLLAPPEKVRKADVLIIESTYGDRLHQSTDAKEELHDVIWETFRKGGILIIPTFAVERAQELLYLLSQLKAENRLPGIPVYLDSPMGVSATGVMMRSPGWQSLSDEEIMEMDGVAHLISDANSSRAIVADARPKIVLAGSGMVTGGRVIHYLDRYLGQERNTILLVGFQAVGTRGRALEEGATELKFFGQYHPVKAAVKKITSLSAHADQSEIIAWLKHFEKAPEQVFINHGEPHASDALRVKIQHELGWPCQVAKPMTPYEIATKQYKKHA